MLTIDNGVFEVKATSGNTHLGGEDIDNRLVNHCVEEFKRKYKKDMSKNDRSMRRLRTACEKAKRTLSSQTSVSIDVDSLYDGLDFNTNLTRARFEDMCMDIFRKTLEPVEKVMQDSKMSKQEIDQIVLVGGSSRIPKVRELLSNYFNGKQLNQSINPDEAVAYGAAIQGAVIGGVQDEKVNQIVVCDVCSLSLGIETAGQIMTVLIPRNTTIPCKKTETFSTYADNQTGCTIRVFEGERKFTKDCNKLGEFNLQGIPPMPRGTPQIEVTYDLDTNGILNVTAVEKSTGKKQQIAIKNEKGRLSKEDIEKMVDEAKKFEADDNLRKEKIEAKNSYENYLYSAKSSLTEEMKKKMSPEDLKELESVADEHLKWIEAHPDESKETYDKQRKEAESKIMPLLMKVYNQSSGTSDNSQNTSPDTAYDTSAGPKVETVD